MRKLMFYVYTIILSDNRYKDGDSMPVYLTIFLLSFLQVFITLPLILWLNSIFTIVSVKTFISLPIYTRYFIIAFVLVIICVINYYFFARGNKIARLNDKFHDRKEIYLKYKWLLLMIVMLTGGIVLMLLRFIR